MSEQWVSTVDSLKSIMDTNATIIMLAAQKVVGSIPREHIQIKKHV